MKKKLSIVMYHYVRELANSRYPGIKGLEYEQFKQQIDFFATHYQVIRMEELIACLEEGYELPENAMLLTFDDGYIDHFTYVFPVLREYKMQGSFFVPGKIIRKNSLLNVNKTHFLLANTPVEVLVKKLFEMLDFYRDQEGWEIPSNEDLFQKYAVANRFDNKETIFLKRVLQMALPERLRILITSELFRKYMDVSETVLAKELYLNYDQMKEMKRAGMFFGCHGYDHNWMNKMEPKVLEKDIDKAIEAMDGLLDPEKWVINYPYGSYSETVINCVKVKGAVAGLSTDVGIVENFADLRYKLPRLDTNDFPPKSENYKILSSL